MAETALAKDGLTLTVRIPIAVRRRGGQKRVIAPYDAANARVQRGPQINGALVKAVVRAFRWRRLIESGAYATIQEIAVAETINDSYAGRILRLTLLAPSVVEAILDGRQPVGLALENLMRPLSAEWNIQQETFRLIDRRS